MKIPRNTLNNKRSQYWVFTVNNYSDADFQRVLNLDKSCEFYVFGKEIAPTTGTHHLQGYIEFNVRKTGGVVKRLFPEQTHLEIAAGSWLDNVRYCCKEGDYYCSDKYVKWTVDVINQYQDLLKNYSFVEQYNICDSVPKQSFLCSVSPRQQILIGIDRLKFGFDYKKFKRRYIEAMADDEASSEEEDD